MKKCFNNWYYSCGALAFSVILSSTSVWATTGCIEGDCSGFDKTAADCSGLPAIKCPFDTSKYFCVKETPKEDPCPAGYVSTSCASYEKVSHTVTVGSKTCRKCSLKGCTDYGYLTSQPYTTDIGNSSSNKYLRCSSVYVADATGAKNVKCYSCTTNNCYKHDISITCNGSKYCCPTGSYSSTSQCNYIVTLVGGCAKQNY